MTGWLRRTTTDRPFLVFSGFAILVTWIGVAPLVLTASSVLDIRIPAEFHAVGALGPFLAAVLVTRWTSGPDGVSALVASLTE